MPALQSAVSRYAPARAAILLPCPAVEIAPPVLCHPHCNMVGQDARDGIPDDLVGAAERHGGVLPRFREDELILLSQKYGVIFSFSIRNLCG